ncbi:phospholipid/cholesterol/gamma-HCH transport system substrate-binding protein [Marmoricola sp. OAE513]|uniref:MCE family protein n=1 Tax=Marmoricola sp. OAE513 TaxID=2817894 RepID=UPI001AEA146C
MSHTSNSRGGPFRVPGQRSLARNKIPSSVYKLAVFAAVTIFTIGVLATLIGNVSFAGSRTFHAYFTDATGVNKGDRVRIAGVEVGTIKGLELVEVDGRKVAKVSFSVEDDVPLYTDAELALRYENIVGQRYLSITEDPSGRTARADSTFGLGQTTPALNLTELFNGFQPLFRALDPKEVNTFSFQIVKALQGESGTLAGLMTDTAELTNGLADRDQVIGGVISNFNQVLAEVGARDTKLTDLIVQFRDLMSGLAKDGDVISASLPSLADLLDSTSGMVQEIRAPLKADLRGLDAVAGALDDTRGELVASLARTPDKMRVLARTGSYGSWFNFYVCGLEVRLQLLQGTVNLGTPALAANERDTVCGGGIE